MTDCGYCGGSGKLDTLVKVDHGGRQVPCPVCASPRERDEPFTVDFRVDGHAMRVDVTFHGTGDPHFDAGILRALADAVENPHPDNDGSTP